MLARLLLARHEQWLDEIISLNLASSVEGPLGIFTALHLDNNHYLNTLWLYAAGPGGSPFLYRLLSLLAGSGAVILLYAAMPRRTAFGRVAAATVFSLSAFMITLTADARGYAPMLFFGILSWMCLRRFLRTGRMTDGLAFTACAMAALLSHLIYIEWYLLLLLWSAKELGGRHKWNTLFLLHLPVLLLLAALYIADIRLLQGYGNPGLTQAHEFIGLWSRVLGPPATTPTGMWAAGAVILFFFLAYFTRVEQWMKNKRMIAAGLLILLLCLSALLRPTVVTRLLLPVFVLLLAGIVVTLNRLWRAGGIQKILCVAFLGLYVACNIAGITWRVRYGWGTYAAAVAFIAGHDPSPVVRVGGSQQFRVPILLEHYSSRIPGGERIEFVPSGAADAPEWYLQEKTGLHMFIPQETFVRNDATYRLEEKSFREGAYWAVYKKTSF